MNYLVTGGAGFIGSNLCKKILQEEPNANIICVDNLCSGSLNNLKEVLQNPKFRFINIDVCDLSSEFDFGVNKIDKIYHLACMASPKYYQHDPIHTLNTCFNGTQNLLKIANKYNSRMLFSSTSEVYGDPLIEIQNEEYWGNVNPNGIRSCYDEGKRVAETLCLDHKKMYGTNICIARIFNTYGPYLNPDDGRVIPNFINQCLRNDNITIYGTGLQTRSFCYIDDLLEGFQALLKSEESGPINIGNPETYTMISLANKIKELTQSTSKIIFEGLPLDDPKIRVPDISKAKKLLNWQPKVNLENGILKTINYFKKCY